MDEEFAARIGRECNTGDQEGDHSRADEILLELVRSLGYEKTADAWENVDKWYA